MRRLAAIVLLVFLTSQVVSAQTATPTLTGSTGGFHETENYLTGRFAFNNGGTAFTCTGCFGGFGVRLTDPDNYEFACVCEGVIIWTRRASTAGYANMWVGVFSISDPIGTGYELDTDLGAAGAAQERVGYTIPAITPGEWNFFIVQPYTGGTAVDFDAFTILGYPALGLYPTQLPYPTQIPYYTPEPHPTQVPYYTQVPYPTFPPISIEITAVIDSLSIEFPTQIPYLTQIPYFTQIPYPTAEPSLTPSNTLTPDGSVLYATVIAPGDSDGQAVRFDWRADAGQVVILLLLLAILITLMVAFIHGRLKG